MCEEWLIPDFEQGLLGVTIRRHDQDRADLSRAWSSTTDSQMDQCKPSKNSRLVRGKASGLDAPISGDKVRSVGETEPVSNSGGIQFLDEDTVL